MLIDRRDGLMFGKRRTLAKVINRIFILAVSTVQPNFVIIQRRFLEYNSVVHLQ